MAKSKVTKWTDGQQQRSRSVKKNDGPHPPDDDTDDKVVSLPASNTEVLKARITDASAMVTKR